MTPPLHNFPTVHNDNKECVKLTFWNANKTLGGQPSVEDKKNKAKADVRTGGGGKAWSKAQYQVA